MTDQKLIINTMTESKYKKLSEKGQISDRQLNIVDDDDKGRTVIASYDLVEGKTKKARAAADEALKTADDAASAAATARISAVSAIQLAENANSEARKAGEAAKSIKISYDDGRSLIILSGPESSSTVDAKPFISDNYLSAAEFVGGKLRLSVAYGDGDIGCVEVPFPVDAELGPDSSNPPMTSAVYAGLSAGGEKLRLSVSELLSNDESIEEKLAISAETLKSEINDEHIVRYEDFEYGGAKRRTIQLENYDNVSGKLSVEEGQPEDAVNLIMVSKWNVVDVGSSKTPMNLNAADGKITINDGKTIATEDQIPLSVSQLENDAGYLTEHQSLSDYTTKDETFSLSTDITSFAEQRVWIKNPDDMDLSDGAFSALRVEKLTGREYEEKVISSQISGNTLYVVDEPDMNAYGRRLVNLLDPELANDAATKEYVDRLHNTDVGVSAKNLILSVRQLIPLSVSQLENDRGYAVSAEVDENMRSKTDLAVYPYQEWELFHVPEHLAMTRLPTPTTLPSGRVKWDMTIGDSYDFTCITDDNVYPSNEWEYSGEEGDKPSWAPPMTKHNDRDYLAKTSDISGFVTAGEASEVARQVSSFAEQRVWIKNWDTSELSDGAYSSLSVVKVSEKEYYELVVDKTLAGNTLYVVDETDMNAYGRKLRNLATPELSGDAATKKYVDDRIDQKIGSVFAELERLTDEILDN